MMTKNELNEKVMKLREWKALMEEADKAKKELEAEIINYLVENDLTEEITDNARITYTEQTRSTLDKKRLEADLGDLTEYTKVTTYSVLRVK